MSRVDFESVQYAYDEEGDEFKFIIELICTANSTSPVYYLSNGDPGYPGDAAEYDIVRILQESDCGSYEFEITEKRLREMVGDEECDSVIERAMAQADHEGGF